MFSQGPEDIEITSGFGPLRPLVDARWEGSTALNDPIETLPAKFAVMHNAVFPTTVW
jgi:hypothetical protein